jgi:hypothetical protein
MGEALIGFGFCLALSAGAVLIFWALQIRYGDTSDLDPSNLLVRMFAKGVEVRNLTPVRAEAFSASDSLILAGQAVTAGSLATMVVFAMILDGRICQDVPFQRYPLMARSSLISSSSALVIR